MKTYRGLTGRDGPWQVMVETSPHEMYALPPRNDIVNHSPDGFAWGYAGSGPSQLALALLVDVMGEERTDLALQLYQAFKGDVIAPLPQDADFSLTEEAVMRWALKKTGARTASWDAVEEALTAPPAAPAPRPRRVVQIAPFGDEVELPGGLPTYEALRVILDGPVEQVRVLREDITGENVYTYMYAHEEGLLRGLPRNQRATDIYLANVRRAFPDAESPVKAAREAYQAELRARGGDFTYISAAPEGYDEDPYIAGTVIWCDGWTCEEVDAEWERVNGP